MEADLDMSIAQVEAELRAAEAYLTTASRPAVASRNGDDAGAIQTDDWQGSSPYERMRAPFDTSESSFFKRLQRTRPAIPEDRRKEILAKLSSERQSAMRRMMRTATPTVEYEGSDTSQQIRRQSTLLSVGFGEETASARQVNYGAERDFDRLNQTQYYDREDTYADYAGGDDQRDRYGEADDDAEEFADADDGGEVFYASDIVGLPVLADVKARTAMDLFTTPDGHLLEENSGDEDEDEEYSEEEADELQQTVPTNYRPVGDPAALTNATSAPSSLFSKLLTRAGDWHQDSDMDISRLLESTIAEDPRHAPVKCNSREEAAVQARAGCQDAQSYDRDQYQREDDTGRGREQTSWNERPGDEYQSLNPDCKRAPVMKTRSRIDHLADPRTHVYADREKVRLMNEMEKLKECTFKPSVLKKYPQSVDARRQSRARSLSPDGRGRAKSVRFDLPEDSACAAFPWLTLSPRHNKLMGFESRQSSMIDRLHLDHASKYEARERLKELLEAERLRECTFQPQINPVSRKIVTRMDYKPIHERVDELQREKTEYIQRIREELAYEDGGYTFTPEINPRSREIAETILSGRQLAKLRSSSRKIDMDDENQVHAMLRPPRVTQRLVEDAEKIAEKRVAVQEYYDALEEKSFAPKISETSSKIAEHRPEFKLDFLSRQEYFQMVEQERLEALEDIVHREQEMTFKPNIGNTDRLLREMRPDLANESTQQRLYRLTYHEPKRNELRKQKLRDQAQRQHTFKPEINPISQALAEKSKAEYAARASRRHELQRYFAGKRFRSRVAKELEQAEIAECTFRPNLVAKHKGKSSSTSKLVVKERQQDGQAVWRSDNILHMIETQRQQRAEELEAKRNALELKELENCTFQPNAHRPQRKSYNEGAKSSEKPVVVRGLGRFLELKERAKRQHEELKEREKKVFHPDRAYEPRSYTVPKPFKLSEASKDVIRRRLKVKEDMRAKERTECTFAPQTIEAQQRKVLRALLKD